MYSGFAVDWSVVRMLCLLLIILTKPVLLIQIEQGQPRELLLRTSSGRRGSSAFRRMAAELGEEELAELLQPPERLKATAVASYKSNSWDPASELATIHMIFSEDYYQLYESALVHDAVQKPKPEQPYPPSTSMTWPVT